MSSASTDPPIEACLTRQTAAADLGDAAVAADDVDELLRQTTETVVDVTGADLAGVVEAGSETGRGTLRAGTGWRGGLVGTAPVRLEPRSPLGETLRGGEPLLIEDLAAREGGGGGELLEDHDVVSVASVPIGPTDEPWGVLGAFATEEGAFGEHDLTFLETVASVIAMAVERARARSDVMAVYDRISNAFFALDDEWRFTHLNARARDLIAPDDDSLLGEVVWEAFPEAVGHTFESEYRRAMREQETVSFEAYYPEPLDAWFEVRAYPSESGLSVYFRDVTERKERERELVQYETIVEAVKDGVYVVDESGQFTMVNEAYAEMTGYDRSELVGEDVTIVVDDAVRERARRSEAALRDGDVGQATVEAEVETASGDRVPMEATFSMLTTPEGEQHRVGVARDVSERKERERELERYETLFTESTDVNAVLAPDGTFQYLPPSVENVLGFEPSELVGENTFERVHPDDREAVREDFERLVEDPEYRPTNEFRYEHADGSWVWLESTGRNLLDDPAIEGLVAYTRDVTERRERERQLSTLMANVPGMVYRCRNEYGWPMEFVSDGCREVTGYDPERLESGALSFGEDLVLEADREQLWTDVQEGLEESGSFLVTYRIETADGSVRWVRERGRGIYDEAGDLAALEGVIIDVTDRKRLEAELDEIFGRVTDAFYALDEEWRFTHVNDRAAELLQHSKSALLGKRIWDLFPAAKANDEVWESFRTAVKTQEAQRYELYFEPLGFWVDATVYPSETGVSVYFRDVTERKERERRLAESERRYRTLAEHFPNGIVTLFDRDLEYTLAAGQGFTDIPVDAASVEGSHFHAVWDAETADALEPVFEAALDGEQRSVELEYEGRDWIVRGVPIADERGEVFAGMTMAQDITERKERERELAKYETIVETINDGIYVKDDDGYFTMVNEAYAELTGYDREELLGAHASLVVDEETIEHAREQEAGAMADDAGNPTMEAPIERADGDTVPTEGTFATIETDGQHESIGVVRDITQRKEQRRRLEESERRYRTLVENFPNGAVALFDEDLRYTAVGGELVDQLGVSTEDRIEQSISDIYPEEILAEAAPYLRATLRGESGSFETEYRGRDLFCRTLPVKDADDEVFAGMLVVQDVTERKSRERTLERWAEQQRAVANIGQFALETEDLDELMDEAAERVADVLDNEYCKVLDLDDAGNELHLRQGVGWRAGIVGEASVSAVENDSQAAYTLAHDQPIVVEDLDAEERFSGPDLLRSHDVKSGISTIIGPFDDPWGILGTHDTDRREYGDEDVVFVKAVANVLAGAIERTQYEAELERLVSELETSNERLEQFAYAASHDLQEPLRMVSSYLQLIEDRYLEDLDEDGEEFLEFAIDGADRMRDMIDGLLAYSRVDTRGDPFEPVDLDALLGEVRADLQVRIEENEATVTAESLPTVHGDASQLRQVLQNLLDNAVEYSGDDPPRVDVSARREGEEWAIAVSDEGIGMDPDEADRAFEVFQSLHGHEEGSGTGIGLALCERIVERHGGEIRVETTPGEGSTFTFTVPAVSDSNE